MILRVLLLCIVISPFVVRPLAGQPEVFPFFSWEMFTQSKFKSTYYFLELMSCDTHERIYSYRPLEKSFYRMGLRHFYVLQTWAANRENHNLEAQRSLDLLKREISPLMATCYDLSIDEVEVNLSLYPQNEAFRPIRQIHFERVGRGG